MLARAARDAGVERLVHLSTAAVYDRSPGAGDVDEASPLVGEDANDYAATKRDTDAALSEVDGITRVLLRPPAILGSGESSVWNTLRPAQIRDDEAARHAVPEKTFAWVHVDDLAALAADIASGRVRTSTDPDTGRSRAAAPCSTSRPAPLPRRDYYETVTGALGIDPIWDDDEAWTGQIVARRAEAWGWTPTVDLDTALAELDAGLRADGTERPAG